MRRTVTPDQVRELFDIMERHGVTIQYKRDGYKVWWHKVAAALAMFMFYLLRKCGLEKDRTFDNFTTVFGKHIYFSSDLEGVGIEDMAMFMTIRHELIHVFQREKYRWWFIFSYLLVLPAWWTLRGSKWEMEAYTQNMIVRHEQGILMEGYTNALADIFVSPSYMYMYNVRSKHKCLRALNDNYEKIKNGEIKGMWPYHPEYFGGEGDGIQP